jgi:hypothetical protein
VTPTPEDLTIHADISCHAHLVSYRL